MVREEHQVQVVQLALKDQEVKLDSKDLVVPLVNLVQLVLQVLYAVVAINSFHLILCV